MQLRKTNLKESIMTTNEVIQRLENLKSPIPSNNGKIRTYKSIQERTNLIERNKILDRAIKALKKQALEALENL
jgi:hypothetical protein